jgi:hypothetical protein
MEVHLDTEMKTEPLSNEKREQYEEEIAEAEHKITQVGGKFTEQQKLDWEHLIKFRKMRLAIDDYKKNPSLPMKNLLDKMLDYHKSLQLRKTVAPQIMAWPETSLPLPAVPLVDYPYQSSSSQYDWHSLRCENWQPPSDTPVHRCIPVWVEGQFHDYYRCDNDDDPQCPNYREPYPTNPAVRIPQPTAEDEDLYA